MKRRLFLETPGGGGPELVYEIRGPRSSWARWSDGDIVRYHDFENVLDVQRFDYLQSLAFHISLGTKRLNSKSLLMPGGIAGGIYGVTPDLALTCFAIAVVEYRKAIDRMSRMVAGPWYGEFVEKHLAS